MNKLPVLKPGEVIHILEGAGFYVDHIRGSHYQMYHPLTRRHVTVPYHGNRDVPRQVLRFIIRQSGLSDEEFLALR